MTKPALQTSAIWGLLAALYCTTLDAQEGLSPALIPIEVLPIEADLASGVIDVAGKRWPQARIAAQPARVARGIVVEGRERVLAMALLGELESKPDGTLELDVAPERRAWCALNNNVLARCYQDLDDDGMLEVERYGALASPEPLALIEIGAPQPTKPRAYRAASAEELEPFQIGYQTCITVRGDSSVPLPELRYSALIRGAFGSFLTTAPPLPVCDETVKVVETRADGSYVAEVGRFKVLLRREADVITTTLLDGIAAGTVLGQLRIDRPFTDALQVAAQRAEAVPATPLLTTVSTPEIASGSVAAGGRIISAGVAHALTGTLRADARAGWSSTPILTAGTPMFGVVMSATTGAYRDSDIVWCAPQRDEAGAVKSLCFAPGNRLVEANLPYVITGVSSSSAGKPAFPPVVSRGPVDFGAPLVLEVRYDSADKRWVRIGFSVAHADAPAWAQLPLRRSPDGGAILAFAGVLVELRPADDLRSVDVRLLGGTPSATAEALPTDAYELLQR